MKTSIQVHSISDFFILECYYRSYMFSSATIIGVYCKMATLQYSRTSTSTGFIFFMMKFYEMVSLSFTKSSNSKRRDD